MSRWHKHTTYHWVLGTTSYTPQYVSFKDTRTGSKVCYCNQKRDTGISYISSGWHKSNRNWPTKTAEVLLRLQSKEIIVRKQIICFVDACWYCYSCQGNWSLLIALASWSWPLECAGQVVSGQRWDHYMGWRDQQKFVRFVICLLLLLSVLLLLLILLNWNALRSLYQLEFMVLQSGYWWSQVLHCI